MASANSRFSLAFSVSKRLQPLGFGHVHAAELALPVVEGRLADPVLAAQVRRLRPSSCSFRTPMICSSVNRLRFIVWSFPKGPDSSSTWIKRRGQRQGRQGNPRQGARVRADCGIRDRRAEFPRTQRRPTIQFSEAVSFQVSCETQEEIDYYCGRSRGGEEGSCCWLNDKYGLSWQVLPAILPDLLADHEFGEIAAHHDCADENEEARHRGAQARPRTAGRLSEHAIISCKSGAGRRTADRCSPPC